MSRIRRHNGIDATTALRLILFGEEIGNYLMVRARLERFSDVIERTGSAAQKAELEELRERLVKAEEHMRVHGKWSLLKWDHPFVQRAERIVAQVAHSRHPEA